MSRYICVDSSVFVKLFIEEDDSHKAKVLFHKIIEDDQIIVLPAFAWAEIGSIIRKKIRRNELSLREADETWSAFRHFPGILYLEEETIADRAWKISRYFDLPTLYDAAFLAVSEEIQWKTGETCEFWTADERLAQDLKGKKDYVSLLKEIGLDRE
ncbi:type II toxin-antitoxin system VapC family toxin [Desulforamulus ruminis]|uniref:PilT domain-containing protein n=1 Tax=Desulforamulus ruminis (strain ATCC 23193 / DSM 2154 / NCIMB 8452 / DL) TaxID=696281 RepID=F6DTU4_DESRL|nr:type II toxin-antitoxin system VapC family toxin [Desulforamulus ruminis]AEG58962.1 PilT domain-containing protein [Desulforamulus ruminis DSM 2154]